MLAGAKADLQPQRAVIAKQRTRIERAFLGHGDTRQQLVDKRLLAEAQCMALAAAVKAADGGRIARHAALTIAPNEKRHPRTWRE
jgi:hypothetical protein